LGEQGMITELSALMKSADVYSEYLLH